MSKSKNARNCFLLQIWYQINVDRNGNSNIILNGTGGHFKSGGGSGPGFKIGILELSGHPGPLLGPQILEFMGSPFEDLETLGWVVGGSELGLGGSAVSSICCFCLWANKTA